MKSRKEYLTLIEAFQNDSSEAEIKALLGTLKDPRKAISQAYQNHLDISGWDRDIWLTLIEEN